MVTLVLEPETERRIAEIAKSRGLSQEELARALIEAGLEDIEDVQMAVDRLGNPLPPLNSAQARKALGLED